MSFQPVGKSTIYFGGKKIGEGEFIIIEQAKNAPKINPQECFCLNLPLSSFTLHLAGAPLFFSVDLEALEAIAARWRRP